MIQKPSTPLTRDRRQSSSRPPRQCRHRRHQPRAEGTREKKIGSYVGLQPHRQSASADDGPVGLTTRAGRHRHRPVSLIDGKRKTLQGDRVQPHRNPGWTPSGTDQLNWMAISDLCSGDEITPSQFVAAQLGGLHLRIGGPASARAGPGGSNRSTIPGRRIKTHAAPSASRCTVGPDGAPPGPQSNAELCPRTWTAVVGSLIAVKGP